MRLMLFGVLVGAGVASGAVFLLRNVLRDSLFGITTGDMMTVIALVVSGALVLFGVTAIAARMSTDRREGHKPE